MNENGPLQSGGRLRVLGVRMILVLSAIILCLAAAEAALRLFAPQPLAGVMFSRSAETGFWNLPNLDEKLFQSEPHAPFYRVTTDSQGYRGLRAVERRKRPGVPRVVVLGDSFTFGVGVNDAETFPARLEGFLRGRAAGTAPRAAAGRVEVVNAACPGWGTENQLAFWRARGRGLRADLLIVAFFRNDLSDNMRHMVYRVANGRPVYAPSRSLGRAKRIVERVPFYRFLSERSHLVNLIRRAVARRILAPAPGARKNPTRDATREKAGGAARSAADSSPLAVYAVLMETLAAEAEAAGTPVFLALLPGRSDCVAEPSADYLAVASRARQWLAEGKIAGTLDLRPALMSARNRRADLFIQSDGHYTAEGNRVVAESLAAALLRANLPPTADSESRERASRQDSGPSSPEALSSVEPPKESQEPQR
jgi:lysophospholipase L1-like esterase